MARPSGDAASARSAAAAARAFSGEKSVARSDATAQAAAPCAAPAARSASRWAKDASKARLKSHASRTHRHRARWVARAAAVARRAPGAGGRGREDRWLVDAVRRERAGW